MSKAPWKPTKQEEDFFKNVILPLSTAILSKYGTLENAIKANPILLQGMRVAIEQIPADGPHVQWIVQQDPSVSLAQLESSRQKLKTTVKKLEEEKTTTVSVTPSDPTIIGDVQQLEEE